MEKPKYNEDEALRLLIAGDQQGLILIYQQYQKKMFSLALDYLGSPDVARDLLQDVFCSLWQQRELISECTTLHEYLSKMCYFKATRHLEKRLKRGEAEKEFIKGTKSVFEDENVLYHMAILEFRKLLTKLTKTQKRVFELVALEGLSYKAAAQQLNVPIQSVSNSMSAAMKAVKHNLSFFALLFIDLL